MPLRTEFSATRSQMTYLVPLCAQSVMPTYFREVDLSNPRKLSFNN